MVATKQAAARGTEPRHYQPSLDEVRALAGEGNLVPVYREIMADLETPVTAYLKVAQGPYSFLLESAEGGERLARYSFIGTDPYLVVRLNDGTLTATHQRGDKQVFPFTDPLEALQGFLTPYTPVRTPGSMDLPRFLGGAVGASAISMARSNAPILWWHSWYSATSSRACRWPPRTCCTCPTQSSC